MNRLLFKYTIGILIVYKLPNNEHNEQIAIMILTQYIELVMKVNFIANYTTMGDKLIIVIPKNYHNLIKKLKKPVNVTIEDLEE